MPSLTQYAEMLLQDDVIPSQIQQALIPLYRNALLAGLQIAIDVLNSSQSPNNISAERQEIAQALIKIRNSEQLPPDLYTFD